MNPVAEEYPVRTKDVLRTRLKQGVSTYALSPQYIILNFPPAAKLQTVDQILAASGNDAFRDL